MHHPQQREVQDTIRAPHAISPPQRDIYSLILGGAAILVFGAIYFGSLYTEPAGDDWLLIHPVNELVRHFGAWGAAMRIFTTVVGDFYRPLAWMPMLGATAGLAWIQAAKLAVMIAFFLLAIRTARHIGLPPAASILVSGAVALHQIFASIVTEVDLWGDVLAAVAVLLLIDLCVRFCHGWRTPAFILWTSAVTAGCLLSKESGVICFLLPLLFLILRPYDLSRYHRRGFIVATGIMLVLTAAYLGVRHELGIRSTGDAGGYYSLSLGPNILENIGLSVLAMFSPVDTIHVALDGKIWKGIDALWVLGLSGLCLMGFLRQCKSRAWRLPLVFFMIAVIAQGPVLLMPHLTEANFTRSIAPGILGFALCLKPFFNGRTRAIVRYGLYLICALWFGFDLWAVHEKSSDIVRGQFRAARFRTEMVLRMPHPDPNLIHVAAIDPGYTGYSVYRQPLLEDIRCGEVPFGLQETYAADSLDADYMIVRDVQDARAKGAQFAVYDNGSVLDLREREARK